MKNVELIEPSNKVLLGESTVLTTFSNSDSVDDLLETNSFEKLSIRYRQNV